MQGLVEIGRKLGAYVVDKQTQGLTYICVIYLYIYLYQLYILCSIVWNIISVFSNMLYYHVWLYVCTFVCIVDVLVVVFQLCRQEDKTELKDMYEMLDRKTEKASVCVEMALGAKVACSCLLMRVWAWHGWVVFCSLFKTKWIFWRKLRHCIQQEGICLKRR